MSHDYSFHLLFTAFTETEGKISGGIDNMATKRRVKECLLLCLDKDECVGVVFHLSDMKCEMKTLDICQTNPAMGSEDTITFIKEN